METENTRKLALVTGASTGIGYELAKQFAENGYDLIICAENAAITGAAEMLAATGASVRAVQLDLTTDDAVSTLWDEATSGGRPVDAVALNAGVGVGGAFIDNEWERELNIINLNIVSTVHLAKLVAKDFVARGEGKILFTSSIASTTPGPFQAVYHASKAFVQSFSQALRNELSDTNITVTALMPGATETPFFERAGMLDTKVGASKKDDPAEVAKQGFAALMAGKDHVVGGSLKNNLMAASGDLLPDTVNAQMTRKMNEPGSAKGATK